MFCCIHPVHKYYVSVTELSFTLLFQHLTAGSSVTAAQSIFFPLSSFYSRADHHPPLFLFSCSAFFADRLLCIYACCVPAAVWTSQRSAWLMHCIWCLHENLCAVFTWTWFAHGIMFSQWLISSLNPGVSEYVKDGCFYWKHDRQTLLIQNNCNKAWELISTLFFSPIVPISILPRTGRSLWLTLLWNPEVL